MIYKNDAEVIIKIMEKEKSFAKEIKELSLYLSQYDIDDYLASLKDIKDDFITPLYKTVTEDTPNKSTLFSDMYWYYNRV